METDHSKFWLPVFVLLNNMSRKLPHPSPRSSPVILWGVSSGFGLIRLATAPVRAFYERRYKTKTKEPVSRIVFIFDSLLVFIIALLAAFVAWIFLSSNSRSYEIRFQTGVFNAASHTPISVSLKAVDKKNIHQNVRVFWKLPSGVEIVEANPPVLSDGSVYLGGVPQGVEVQLRAIVKTYRPAGDKIRIGLQIEEGRLFDRKTTYASMDAEVENSGLFAEIPSEIAGATHVVPRGASLPIRIVNPTDEEIPNVELRPTDDSEIRFSRQALGMLAPHEERFVYLPLGFLDRPASLSWSLIASGYEIVSSTWRADVIEWPNTPEIVLNDVQKQHSLAHVAFRDADDATIVILNPTVSSTINVWKEKNLASVDIGIGASPSPNRLAVIPVGVISNSSSRILGPASFSLILGSLPLKTSVRYTAASGDQIGVGPHPPEKNEETRYWAFFTVDQSEIPLKNIHLKAAFPKSVELTGSVAVPDGGTWTTVGRSLEWILPAPASSHARVMIGVEVAVTPSGDPELPLTLISSVDAEAEDAASGTEVEAKQGGVTTEDVDR